MSKKTKTDLSAAEDALPVVWTCSQVRNSTGFQTPLFKSQSLKRSFAKKYQDSGCFQSGGQSHGGGRNKIIHGPCTAGAWDPAAERRIRAENSGLPAVSCVSHAGSWQERPRKGVPGHQLPQDCRHFRPATLLLGRMTCLSKLVPPHTCQTQRWDVKLKTNHQWASQNNLDKQTKSQVGITAIYCLPVYF